jgi:hypothetical protein
MESRMCPASAADCRSAMAPGGNKKERVPAGAHSQKPLPIETMRSYEKSTTGGIGDIAQKSKTAGD